MRGVDGDLAMLVARSTEIEDLIGDQTGHGMQNCCRWDGFHWARNDRVLLTMELDLAQQLLILRELWSSRHK